MPEIKEGKARIRKSSEAFFNPKMKKLRDISVEFLKSAAEPGFSVLDATAATGVRGIRYMLESGASELTMLDINKHAFEETKKNAKLNKIKSTILNKSIQSFASDSDIAFDVIDLDPFGTPAPYINDLLKVCKDSTLLMVTATDTAVLCGAHLNACIKLYGSKPLHNELCHESGVRILLAYIARIAASFNFGMLPLLSIADMHYMRVFVKLQRGAKYAVASVKEIGHASFCSKCHSFSYAKNFVPPDSSCISCSKKQEMYGPMWFGNLNSKNLLESMLSKGDIPEEAEKLLSIICNEPEIPFFYSIPKLTKTLHRTAVSPKLVQRELEANGFIAQPTHFADSSIKTNADIKQIMKFVSKL